MWVSREFTPGIPVNPSPNPHSLWSFLSSAEENEERTMIDPTSREDPKFKELVKVSHSLMWLDHPCWFWAFFWGIRTPVDTRKT